VKRRTTEAERELFRAAVAGPSADRKPRVPDKPAKPAARKASLLGGVDGRTAKRLDRGLIAPGAKLDLHGLTETAAHRALVEFLQTAHKRGDRLVLVVTGKGAIAADASFDLGLAGRRRGVLKAMVPRWLRETRLAHLVADVRAAHPRHGGEGALYVYMRKV
jgi:DNA-nicking Smr family endonuclease